MSIVFWLSLWALVYIYVGYPALVWGLARLFGREPRRAELTPQVSLLIPAHNEEAHIEAKLANALALDYPRERLEIVVASDGSTDRTCEIARRFSPQGVRLVRLDTNVGKSAMLSRVVPGLRGEIVVFSDASSLLEPDALRRLVRPFADPKVGCVGGLYRLLSTPGAEQGFQSRCGIRAHGEGLYWRYETFLKRQESRLSSILGAHGAFYGIRKALFRPLERESVNDDYLIPMRIVAQGYRAVYEHKAQAWERHLVSSEREFVRRKRIAAGNCQQVIRLFSMLNPARGWVAFSFFSHKVLRTASPLFLLALLVSNFWLATPLRELFLTLQALFIMAAWLGYRAQRAGRRILWLSPPFYFYLTNLATLAGLVHFFRHPDGPLWERAH